jgi:serine/threonine-protein kinase HipA
MMRFTQQNRDTGDRVALYIGDTERSKALLRKASERRAIRAISRGVYTDDFERPDEEIVGENLLALIGRLLPGWHLSHSSAALRGPVDGFLFVSGPTAVTGRNLELPGVHVIRLRQLAHPETDLIEAPTQVATGLQSPPQPVFVRVSTPLQTVFEVLSIARTYPQKKLGDEVVAEMIGRLPAVDRERAERFAARNGLRREFLRYQAISFGTAAAAGVRVQEPDAFDLYFYGWQVGTLTHLGSNEYRFTYAPGWPTQLSPQLPRATGGASYEGRGMPAFIENTLPEGWTERVVLASNKLSREDLFGLLSTTRKYLSNLTLRPLGIPEDELEFDALSARLDDLARVAPGTVEASEEIGGMPDDPELWRRNRLEGPLRVSGVQAKLPVSLTQGGGAVHLRLGDLRHPATHILKLPAADFPRIVENEWATMELARRAGLNAAPVAMVSFGEESAYHGLGRSLLVERYDIPPRATLKRAGSGLRLMLQEDACSLLLLPRERKYATSMERVADALKAAGVPADARENGMDAFLKLAIFSWIVGNGDLHAKNVSVMRFFRPDALGRPPAVERVEMTPLYDLVSTRLYIRRDDFALPVDGRRQKLKPRNFVTLAQRWGATRADVLAAIEEIGRGIRTHLDAVLGESGLLEEQAETYRTVVRENLEGLGF